jgi:hypothetical protein
MEEKRVTREEIEALHKSDQDIKAGRVKEVTSVEDMLTEL